MSSIFEGIIVPVPVDELGSAYRTIQVDLSLTLRQLDGATSTIYRNDPRSKARFTETIDKLAAKLSERLGKALVVRCDSRVGYRSSTLYAQGRLAQSFDDDDEVWVPIDEAAEALGDGPHLKASELEPDEEYATIYNAVQLGLAALGQGSWDDVSELIAAA